MFWPEDAWAACLKVLAERPRRRKLQQLPPEEMTYSIPVMQANKRACRWQHNAVFSRGTHAYPGAYGERGAVRGQGTGGLLGGASATECALTTPWPWATWPSVPAYGRATPTARRPWLGEAGIVQPPPAVGRTLRHPGGHALLGESLGIPGRIGQHRLSACGRGAGHRRSDGGAVLALQVCEQTGEGNAPRSPDWSSGSTVARRVPERWRAPAGHRD